MKFNLDLFIGIVALFGAFFILLGDETNGTLILIVAIVSFSLNKFLHRKDGKL